MKTEIIAGIAALAFIGGAYSYGYHKGSLAEVQKIAEKTAETQQELLDLNEVVRMQTEALRQAQREKEELIYALEEEARSAPGSGNPGVDSTGGLQRLERRWGPNSRTAN